MQGQTVPSKSSDIVKDMLPGHAAFLELISGCSGNELPCCVPEKKTDTA